MVLVVVMTHVCDGGGRRESCCLLLLAAQRLAAGREAAGVTNKGGKAGEMVANSRFGRPAAVGAQGRGEERERGKKEGPWVFNVREGVCRLD